jgi:hypothetical protein
MTPIRRRSTSETTYGTLAGTFAALYLASGAGADPLPGRDVLKFSQRPMIHTTIPDSQGITQTYFGHDELSTLQIQGGVQPPTFSGEAMADDFADNFDTPVVHVKWWGSYMGLQPGQTSPPVNNFLIAFESDVPQDPANPFSHPGQVLSSQVVTAGALSPMSGTFTETPVAGSNPNETVYEYNAELKVPFEQQKDTVYWLKIAALVNPGAAGDIRWGWHNRDYSITDAQASAAPSPGERDQRIELADPNFPSPVWHFQDDSVVAFTTAVINPSDLSVASLVQQNYVPQNYIVGLDGPAALPGSYGGIDSYSKDLAFELYTVPEPAALPFLVIGGYVLLARRRRRQPER